MTNFPEFQEFRKIPRLSRDIVITEKIDGTNGLIYIDEQTSEMSIGSRTRWLDEHTDNHGFYHWAMEEKEELLKLGKGYHYGEWWGSGIQRGYDLPKGEKRFSLFNTKRWIDSVELSKTINPEYHGQYLAEQKLINKNIEFCPECCYVVPILYQGIFDMIQIEKQLDILDAEGSKVAPGFMKPEGIVIYHTAGNLYFKKTIENDEKAKGEK